MFLVRFRAIALLVTTSVVTGYGQNSPANRPWPPGVQKVSDESPPLSPADALKTFYMPPGYHLELVASEPLIQDPTVMDWDLQGRLWVVEMTGFVRDLETPEPNLARIGNVVVLEDTNHDGRMDKRTVFADGLMVPRALKVLDRGVLVGEPGSLWLMRDTNGDLRADTKELVTGSYGRLEGSVEGNANSVYWALDNRMHTAGQADVFFRLKDLKVEVLNTLPRGEWGVTQDDAGRIYRNTNESALHVDFVPTPYYARNPNLLRTRGSYEPLRDPDNAINTVWPVRPNPGTNRAYQAGIDRADGTLAKFTAVCAPLVYRGDRLPPELYGNAFVAEPAANLVSRIILTDDGTTLRARKAYDNAEFLASTDERFRPVYLSNGPDGTLYIVDMYRGIIQDRASTTVYLRDHIIRRKLDRPIGMGRIYRVVHETTRRDTATTLATATPAQLVEALEHPNGWWRDTAQRLLVERGARPVVGALTRLAGSAKDPRARLHALWTLDGIDSIERATVMKALDDTSRDVRASAIRIAERWLGDPADPIQAAVLKRIEDGDWAVRQQLAASLGILPTGARETAAVAFLERHAGDPIALDATLSGLRGSEAAVLEKMLHVRLPPQRAQDARRGPRLKPDATDAALVPRKPGATDPGAQTPPRETAITMLAATIVRSAQDGAVQNVFTWAADESLALWQRSALLRGAEVALLGAAMPGAPAGRRGGAAPAPGMPCPTCPGGRAGPGGAYAFERQPRLNAAAPGGRGSGPGLRLSREPSALSALAARGGDLGPRASNLLARVEWPGKPGAAAPIKPLTAEEQLRFSAGQEVYRNICQACHQPDGRGQERLAPSLVGSPLALGPAEIPARILLHGKEGSTGLMPPLGQAFNDDQIAAVLTYIRREWGQAGEPVDAAAVKNVRAMTADRTRPWTTDELTALMPGGRQQR
jgi:mono/diheme cytochrome c family protein/glucose/arabinose dehydrogenase